MPQALSCVYVHITFSTKYRYPFIDNFIKERLWEYIGGICKNMDCSPIQIGGYTDHVHILCTLSRKVTQMKLIENIKRSSSLWIKTIDRCYSDFYWQKGYGIFSVNPSQISLVVEYIKNQEQHHSTYTFQKELMAFIRKYGIDCDENYLTE